MDTHLELPARVASEMKRKQMESTSQVGDSFRRASGKAPMARYAPIR